MKKRIIKLIACFAVSVISALLFTTAVTLQNMQKAFDDELYNNVIRLHILAESDSLYDQNIKLAIRDNVKDHIYSIVADSKNISEAEKLIYENISSIEKAVCESIESLGCDYSSKVSFEKEYYPVRYYDGFSFPAGNYRSLKITLGSGKGKNWWCVLYPTVCNSMATDARSKLKDAGISEKTADMICGKEKKYEYGMYILELFKMNE